MRFSFLLSIIGATFFMGSSFVASKILLKTYNMMPFNLVGWRFVLAAIATLPIIFLTQSSFRDVKKSDWTKISIIGLLQTGLTMGFLFLSMLYVSASSAAALMFCNPLIVALASPIILKEKLSKNVIIGLLVGIVGVWLIVGADTNLEQWRGILLGLACAISFASSTIYNRKVKLQVPPFIISATQMLIGAIFLLICAFFFEGNQFKLVDKTQTFWFLWLAIPASTGSFGLWAIALNKGGAVVSSSFLFLVPLFTIIISHFVLNTDFSLKQLIGAGLIGFALFVTNKIV